MPNEDNWLEDSPRYENHLDKQIQAWLRVYELLNVSIILRKPASVLLLFPSLDFVGNFLGKCVDCALRVSGRQESKRTGIHHS